MTTTTKVIITIVYGVWLAAAGILRGSNAALGFGFTTAVMAIIGAVLLSKGKRVAAQILIAVTLVFVVGFFISKSVREGLDIRVGIILLSSLIEAVVLFLPAKASAESPTVSVE
jgi:hypothetical protein